MATFTPTVKSVGLESRPLVLLLILMNFISDGQCENISLTCPQLQDNVLTKFICSFDTSMCTNPSVFFDFKSKDGNYSQLCTTSSTSPCGPEPVDGMACGCVLSNSSYRIYQLNLNGDRATYNEGNLNCSVKCTSRPVVAFCQPLSFAVTTSYSPAATASPNSSSTTANGGAGSGNSMHVLKKGIIAYMSGIFVLISVHLN